MLQIEFFNRLDPKTKEHHIDDTYIVVGPIDSFQWTYGHLRLVVDGGEIDLVRFKNSAIQYKDMFVGECRITSYDVTNKDIEKFG